MGRWGVERTQKKIILIIQTSSFAGTHMSKNYLDKLIFFYQIIFC